MGFKLILRGRVQGVGCRYYCAQTARRMKLHGAVTNRADGSVDVLLNIDAENRATLYAENLRTNHFGFSFYGTILSIEKELYNGNYTGDYKF